MVPATTATTTAIAIVAKAFVVFVDTTETTLAAREIGGGATGASKTGCCTSLGSIIVAGASPSLNVGSSVGAVGTAGAACGATVLGVAGATGAAETVGDPVPVAGRFGAGTVAQNPSGAFIGPY